jgi:hypothetical protein
VHAAFSNEDNNNKDNVVVLVSCTSDNGKADAAVLDTAIDAGSGGGGTPQGGRELNVLERHNVVYCIGRLEDVKVRGICNVLGIHLRRLVVAREVQG